MENLRYHGTRPVDMNLPAMQAILKVAESVGPNQYKVEWADFTLMLYPTRGNVIFHATAKFVMNAGLSFLRFMTHLPGDVPPGPGLTRKDALDLAAKLQMFYAEEETRVLGDFDHLLPEKRERLFEVIFKPDDPTQKKLLNIIVDFSKGGEWVHEGHPGLGGGLAETIKDPLKAVGVLAEVVAFCNSVGQSFNELNVAAGEGFAQSARQQQQATLEVARVARVQQMLSSDITTLMGQVPADLTKRLDVIQGSLTALGGTFTQPRGDTMAETNGLLRDLIEATRDMQTGIQQSVIHIDEEQAERLRVLEDVTTQTKELLEHHHKDAVIRDNATNVHLEQVKQDLTQVIGDKFERLATYLEISRVDLVKLIQVERDALLARIKVTNSRVRWIRKNALEYYATTLAILKQVPEITAKQLATILEVKHTRVYYWLQRLADFDEVGKEHHAPDPSPQEDSKPYGLGSRDPQPSEKPAPMKKEAVLRRVWHYFRRPAPDRTHTQSNEKAQHEDEKT